MFGIRYQDELLDLVPGQNPVIEWVSTAFNDGDVLLGSYSYPIDLADSPKNNRLLGHANQMAMRLSRRDITVQIELFDRPWKSCTLTFEIDDRVYKSNLKIDNGEFASVIKKITIPEVFQDFKDGVFVDHKWELVGEDPESTASAIENAVSASGAAAWTMYPYQNSKILGTYNGDGEPNYIAPAYVNRWPLLLSSDTIDTRKETWYGFSFYLTWVLRKVCDYLGYQATGDFFQDPFILSLVLDNDSVYCMEDVFAEAGFKIAPARHLAGITIGDIIKSIRNNKKLIYHFDSDTKKAYFMLSANVINSTERIEIEKYVEKGFRTGRQRVNGYEIIQAIDDKDELFDKFPYVKSFTIGSGSEKQKIELAVSTTFMITRPNTWITPVANFRIPMKDRVGNSFSTRAAGSESHNPEGYGRNDFGLKLLSYRGLRPDSEGTLYPYATSDGLDTDGVTILCPSLWLGGEGGILNTYHINWYQFLLPSEPIELKAKIPDNILNQISPIKKIHFQSEEGIMMEALMDKILFTTDKDKLMLSTRLSVYPIFGQLSLPGIGIFTPGEIVNEETVFVKLLEENIRPRYRKRFLGAKVKESEIVDLVMYFYSDFAGTIPISVSNLAISYIEHYKGIHPENYRDTTVAAVALGSRFVVQNNILRWYQWNDEFETYTWTIAPGPGYVAIP